MIFSSIASSFEGVIDITGIGIMRIQFSLSFKKDKVTSPAMVVETFWPNIQSWPTIIQELNQPSFLKRDFLGG